LTVKKPPNFFCDAARTWGWSRGGGEWEKLGGKHNMNSRKGSGKKLVLSPNFCWYEGENRAQLKLGERF